MCLNMAQFTSWIHHAVIWTLVLAQWEVSMGMRVTGLLGALLSGTSLNQFWNNKYSWSLCNSLNNSVDKHAKETFIFSHLSTVCKCSCENFPHALGRTEKITVQEITSGKGKCFNNRLLVTAIKRGGCKHKQGLLTRWLRNPAIISIVMQEGWATKRQHRFPYRGSQKEDSSGVLKQAKER